MNEQPQPRPGGAKPPETRCDLLAGILADLVAWNADAPLTWFGDQLHGAIVMLAHDLMAEECAERAT
jgi:hypothetical protein